MTVVKIIASQMTSVGISEMIIGETHDWSALLQLGIASSPFGSFLEPPAIEFFRVLVSRYLTAARAGSPG